MLEIKAMDQAGLDFLIAREGLRLKPYLDTRGIPTISVGVTFYPDGRKVTMNDPALTKDQAIDLFKRILKGFETTVWSLTRDDISQNNFNALTSFCFNIGQAGFKGSTVLKRVNANPKDPKIADALMMWTKNKELIGRRKKEVALYFS